ncbi:MAG: peptidoglycan-binding domain-containing protein [Thermodesulfobacteriota bacterium]|jgi:uncharacterized protein YcfJ|nr:MAG: peptidoglycan-binding domain-containing protein [Thermodesulfobacteriota bacterium]
MKKLFFMALVLAIIISCANAQRWVQDNPKTALGIAAGAATGGLAGGLIGHQVGHTAGGLLIGAGLGGVAGGLIGNSVEDRGSSSHARSRSSSSRYDPAVADVQKSLNCRGYNCGAADGIMGSRTRQAVMRFQRDHGLPVDGIAGPATCAKIRETKNSEARNL